MINWNHTHFIPNNNDNIKNHTHFHAQINMYNITPTFALGLESFAFQYCYELASTLHSPVTRNNIQTMLAISAPGNGTIKAGTQLLYSKL